MKLSIGLVGPLPPPSGGMANQTLQLAQLLRTEGAKVELIQTNAPYRPLWMANFKAVRAVFRLLPYLVRLWCCANRVTLFHVMANSGWSWHLFAAPAIWIAKAKGIPVIVNYRGGEAETFFEKAFFWVKPTLMQADAIVVPSGFLEAVFKKRGFASSTVPNIIDLARFSASAMRHEDAKIADPHILVARNLEPIYDNATALRAFHIVKGTYPTARLTVAGSGPEHAFLMQLASDLGLADAVDFTGRVDNAGMANLYRSADVMINPSLVDNMPISVLEALACGIPVVSTNVGGVPYLVEHEKTAMLVPARHPQSMAAAILTLLDDPAKAQKIREEGIQSVRQYAWPNVRNRLLQVYEQAIARKTKSMAGLS